MIAQQRGRFHLRNWMWNLGHTQPNPLDATVTEIEQQYWANGYPQYSDAVIESIREAVAREPGPTPKLLLSGPGWIIMPNGKSVADVVIDELANVIESVILSPAATERAFWTLSDYPQTAGGRFATLNVGPLEIAYFLHRPLEMLSKGAKGRPCHVKVVNAALGSFAPVDADSSAAFLGESRRVITAHKSVQFDVLRSSYALTLVDQIISRLGTLDLRLLRPDHLGGVRKLAIEVMRNKSATLKKRHHADELTRLDFSRLIERHDENTR